MIGRAYDAVLVVLIICIFSIIGGAITGTLVAIPLWGIDRLTEWLAGWAFFEPTLIWTIGWLDQITGNSTLGVAALLFVAGLPFVYYHRDIWRS